jgi:thiamine biosynthesis lipoprotein
MKQIRLMMGMPITIEIVAETAYAAESIDAAFDYFQYVDNTFSTYKEDSEISRINRGELALADACQDMRDIFALADETKRDSDGFFDIAHKGIIDPSGIVKGWAIYNAAALLLERGFENFYVDAGGDIQAVGQNADGENWRVGIRNPFNMGQIVKALSITDCGIATSGNTIRGQHIYNPKSDDPLETRVVSLTVVGPNVYDADRFATAAYAMGEHGILFIEELAGFEGYQIDSSGIATFTSGFERYVL